MKGITDLLEDIKINIRVFGGGKKVSSTDYPDNEWGIMLAHFDSSAHVFGGVNAESKQQALQQEYFSSLSQGTGREVWEMWKDQNPDLPTIPHDPAFYDATVQACEYFANPLDDLRKCLAVLADGGSLSKSDWPVFVLMYAEFRQHLAILHSRDPDVDPLKRERSARKNNNDKLMRYAATFISGELDAHKGMKMENARNVFAHHVQQILEDQISLPNDWTEDEFKIFLGEPDQHGARLKKQFGQDLTRKKLKDWS
jgi:hypothetical protein